ncbi:unnamed protein product [Caenorhabditis auriculariae]|uniref:Uncharacterized protein n=1 Tax=Caenorhabditis auriculariae TaxID=2777116 RepID=A0A8S1H5P0_9PELO|nr:unnamed protein product [Caenorhabditis auriculariae]
MRRFKVRSKTCAERKGQLKYLRWKKLQQSKERSRNDTASEIVDPRSITIESPQPTAESETSTMDTSHEDEANASQRPDRPDTPQLTHSMPMSYYQGDAMTEFLRRNERLMGPEMPTYQVAVRRNRSGEARLELTLVPARMSPNTTMAMEVQRTETARGEWEVHPERNGSDLSQNLAEARNFSADDLNVEDDEEGKVEMVEKDVESPEGNPAVSSADSWVTMRKRKAGDPRSAQPPKRQLPGPTGSAIKRSGQESVEGPEGKERRVESVKIPTNGRTSATPTPATYRPRNDKTSGLCVEASPELLKNVQSAFSFRYRVLRQGSGLSVDRLRLEFETVFATLSKEGGVFVIAVD